MTDVDCRGAGRRRDRGRWRHTYSALVHEVAQISLILLPTTVERANIYTFEWATWSPDRSYSSCTDSNAGATRRHVTSARGFASGGGNSARDQPPSARAALRTQPFLASARGPLRTRTPFGLRPRLGPHAPPSVRTKSAREVRPRSPPAPSKLCPHTKHRPPAAPSADRTASGVKLSVPCCPPVWAMT